MGVIEKFVRSTGERATDTLRNFGDKLKTVVSRVQGYCGTAFEVAKNGSTFVGMKYDEIPNIRAAIRTYVTNVQKEVDKLNTEAVNTNALKGEVAAAANSYVKAVSDVANAYVSSLLAYSDKMYEYGENYKQSDTNVASNVSDEASSLAGSAEVYTEKY